jgi:hypothetical protein
MMSSKRSARTAASVAHALRFQLEHADGVAALEHLVVRSSSQRQLGEIDVDPRALEQSTARCSTVSVLRPRKSNFTSPAGSTYFMLNCVTGMSERGSR